MPFYLAVLIISLAENSGWKRILYLQNASYSMLLFYKRAVCKPLCDDVGNLDTDICMLDSWRAAPAILLAMFLFFLLALGTDTTILVFHRELLSFAASGLREKTGGGTFAKGYFSDFDLFFSFFLYCTSVPTVLYGL